MFIKVTQIVKTIDQSERTGFGEDKLVSRAVKISSIESMTEQDDRTTNIFMENNVIHVMDRLDCILFYIKENK